MAGIVLGFDDRRIEAGSYTVYTPDAEPVASVSPSFWRSRFEAATESGEPLCVGKARLISGWVAYDPQGELLTLLQVRPFHYHRTILRGGEIECRSIGRAFTADWYLRAGDGRTLLEAVPPQGTLLPTDVWMVRGDGTLTLAETISVVELHRLEQKRKRRRHPSSARLARRRELRLGRSG